MAWHSEHLSEDERALVYDLDCPLAVRHALAIRYTWELRGEVQRLRELLRAIEQRGQARSRSAVSNKASGCASRTGNATVKAAVKRARAADKKR